ncbi:MAG: hypothetical protein EOO20_00345 [Chryseobacterium sp.]|nr:MAG: hypothetical protein EOO20_00345 [Chryseobacterium sp.]
MSGGIKTLADEIKENIKKNGNNGQKEIPSIGTPTKQKSREQARKTKSDPLDQLFESILSYELNGSEKMLIRLDERTVFLLKQLKIAKGIDMNKLIAYSLKDFLVRHSGIIQYIKENIKTIEI